MVKICFLLLAHKNPQAIIEQANYLSAFDDYVVIHIDKNANATLHNAVAKALADNPNIRIVKPVKAGWGDWSLIKGALRMIKAGLAEFPDATHFYHVSGDCMPIRSRNDLARYLENSNHDIIESADFYNSGWIKTGPHHERVDFYHFINERKYKASFYRLYKIQRFLGIKRKVPEGLKLSIGSQWWCLRRETLEKIQLYISANPHVPRFFKRCWIPDEIFFQTLAATLVEKEERESRPPTFLYFSDYGQPIVFSNDHYDFLTQQDSFFARKISGNASELRERLKERFLAEETQGNFSQLGRKTLEYTIYSGRVGRRFGQPIWFNNEGLRENATVFVVAAKKWHVGERIAKSLSEATGIPNYGYVFENSTHNLPSLGGISTSQPTRKRAPLVFLNAILDQQEGNRMIICIDPSTDEAIRILRDRGVDIRLFEFEHRYDEDYLSGHASRIGVIEPHGNEAIQNEMYVTILENFRAETRKLRSLDLPFYAHFNADCNRDQCVEIVANGFDIQPEQLKSNLSDLDMVH